MGFYVELEDFSIEAFRPSSSEDVYELSLGHCCCVGEGEEEFGGEYCPFVDLGVVDLYGGEAFFSIIPTEDVDATVTDYGCEGTPWGV